MEKKIPQNWKEYQEAVNALESEGVETSDAQAIIDALLLEAGVKL